MDGHGQLVDRNNFFFERQKTDPTLTAFVDLIAFPLLFFPATNDSFPIYGINTEYKSRIELLRD